MLITQSTYLKIIFQGSRGPAGEDGEIGKPGATVCKTKFLSIQVIDVKEY